ncbi:MAG: hypothetical protein ABIT16_12535 [Croceibacterium sp.]
MKRTAFVVLAAPFIATGCADVAETGLDRCTREAIGSETGADDLRVTLEVPERFTQGVEVSNGGITAWWDDCDFPLNTYMSTETANRIIDGAPKRTLTDRHLLRHVEASLSIFKFSDGSGEPRFFVMRVQDMAPITTPRTAEERDRFSLPAI